MSLLAPAVALFAAGRFDEARRASRKALQKRADLVEAYLLLAEIARRMEDAAQQAQAIDRIKKLRPAWTLAHVELALGDLNSDLRFFAEAEGRYRAAIAIEPRLSDARFNLASVLRAQDRIDDCVAELRALVEMDPSANDAREQLVRHLQDARRFDEVDVLCRAGMERDPAEAFFAQKLGVSLWWRGRHDEALAAYRLAAERAGNPQGDAYRDARFLEASALLTLGRYREGWENYRFRPSRPPLRAKHPGIAEQPSRFAGEGEAICIYAEQGLGDELFFLRFAVDLQRKGHRLAMVCEPRLATLLAAAADPFIEFNPPSSWRADIALASGDLPFASGQESAPPLKLTPEPTRIASVRERLSAFGPPPYVGVTWRAGVLSDMQAPATRVWTKDVAADALGLAIRPSGASVVVLQRRPQPDDMRKLVEALGKPALDLSASNDDLRDALAVLAVLDHYVGMSNTNMHLLAGLPSAKAHVLVQTPAEWRWGLTGPASPWFPNFRLYRQQAGGGWESALAALSAHLYAAMQHE